MANNVTDLGKVGITLKGEWNSSASYERLDTVTYEGSLYIAIRDNVGSQPSESNTNWMLGAKHGEFTEQQLEDFKAEVVAESKEEMDDYTDDKKTELDTYTGAKKAELDTYEGTKEAELNTYASGLKDDFDSNATSKTNAFNTNATSKTNDFDSNAVAKTTAFDTNASTKTSAFDDNATAKTTAFDENAEEKTGDFNDNADTKTAEFDAHVEEKEAEFDENVDSIQDQITDIQEFIDSELEQGITEKGTRADVNDSAKWYGELAPEGRTEQKQLQGYNLFDYTQVVQLAYGTRQGESSSYILASSLYRGYYIPVTPGEQYFISRKNTTDFNRFRACCTEVLPELNVPVIPGSIVSRDGLTDFSITIPENGQYLFLYLSNNSEDITPEMELQITKSEELLPYEPFVGGTASPNPDYPQEIRNVEGRSCRNLFDGEWTGSVSTNFIPVYAGKNYKYSEHGVAKGMNFRFYNDTSSTEYTTVNVSSSDYYTPEADGYVKLYKTAADKYDCQLEEGTAVTPYEPYFEGKRLEFNVCNKNLLDINKSIPNKNIYSSGIILDSSFNNISDYIDVSAFNNLYIYFEYIGTPDWNTCFFDSQKNVISGGANGLSSNTREMVKPSNASYIRFCYPKDATKVMLAGSTSTPYEGHKKQMIPFPLQEGQKLMEGDYLAEDGVHHVRGQVVLDGTENWILQNASAGQFLKRNSIGGNVILSDKFKVKSSYTSSGKPYLRGNLYAEIGTEFLNEISVEAWKGWLQNNPVLVEYELDEETIDPYTPAQLESYNKLMNLMLYKGVNHIWTETDGLEPNLQLTYYKSNKERLNNIEARLELLEN